MKIVVYGAAVLALLFPQLLPAGQANCAPLEQPTPQPFADGCSQVFDDRTPLNPDAPDRARLVYLDNFGAPVQEVPCTASLYNETYFITADHCLRRVAQGTRLALVQFNVPPSGPDGELNHPPPEDQYCVNVASIIRIRSPTILSPPEVALFTVLNNIDGNSPFEVQRSHVFLDGATAGRNEAIDIVGYGHDDDNDQEDGPQQIRFSTVVDPGGPGVFEWLTFHAKTADGDSGSAVISQVSGEVLGILSGSTTTECAVTNASVTAQPQINDAMCGAVRWGSPIPCVDIDGFERSCEKVSPGRWRLTATVAVAGDHDGSKVKITIDGTDYIETVTGNRAQVQLHFPSAGAHPVQLSSPACRTCDACGETGRCGDCDSAVGQCSTCQCTVCATTPTPCDDYCDTCGASGAINDSIVRCIDVEQPVRPSLLE